MLYSLLNAKMYVPDFYPCSLLSSSSNNVIVS